MQLEQKQVVNMTTDNRGRERGGDRRAKGVQVALRYAALMGRLDKAHITRTMASWPAPDMHAFARN